MILKTNFKEVLYLSDTYSPPFTNKKFKSSLSLKGNRNILLNTKGKIVIDSKVLLLLLIQSIRQIKSFSTFDEDTP